MKTSAQTYDVIVIGAGAAGLAAAARLATTPRSILLLEARDRIGGRRWTLREPGLAVPIELGAEFIHGASTATMRGIEQAGLAIADAGTEHWFGHGGKLKRR